MSQKEKKSKIKNLKISEESHSLLKVYCKKNGLKMFYFVEKLIHDNCKPEKGSVESSLKTIKDPTIIESV